MQMGNALGITLVIFYIVGYLYLFFLKNKLLWYLTLPSLLIHYVTTYPAFYWDKVSGMYNHISKPNEIVIPKILGISNLKW